jgi:sec-independent protein translocase protein TatA
MKIGGTELLVILIIVLVIFGGGKLAGVGSALGKAIKDL